MILCKKYHIKKYHFDQLKKKQQEENENSNSNSENKTEIKENSNEEEEYDENGTWMDDKLIEKLKSMHENEKIEEKKK